MGETALPSCQVHTSGKSHQINVIFLTKFRENHATSLIFLSGHLESVL